MATITIGLNLDKIHSILAKRYVEDFGKLDNRFYFMSGFVTTAFSDEIEKNAKENKKTEPLNV